jgi:hypothetical protein
MCNSFLAHPLINYMYRKWVVLKVICTVFPHPINMKRLFLQGVCPEFIEGLAPCSPFQLEGGWGVGVTPDGTYPLAPFL